MIPRVALLLLAIGPLAAIAATQEPDPDAPATKRSPTVVFFVRHAETATSTRESRDPALSEAGSARASALARLLRKSRASRMFATDLQRTQQTLAPLAGALGVEIEVLPARETARQIETLRALEPGTIAVVAGHSNTVPAMVQALGGTLDELEEREPYGALLHHDAYDRVFEVVLPHVDGAAVHTTELRYSP